jgi:general secretion pathway protein E
VDNPAAKSTSSQNPAAEPPVAILRRSADVPREAKLMWDVSKDALAVPREHQKGLAVLFIERRDRTERSDRHHRRGTVWLLSAPGFKSERLHAYRHQLDKIRKAGHELLEKDADPSLIKLLYDNATGSINVNDLDDEDSDYVNYFTKIVRYALENSISDIHIEKRSTTSRIRMRRYGYMIEYAELSNEYATQLCSVVYNVLAENKEVTFREDKFQSSGITRSIDEEHVNLRYQSLPVYPGGFDVVMRVLPIGGEDEPHKPLEELGYTSGQVEQILKVVVRPVGALVIAGTTGSGKSTTLKNLLMWINASREYRCKVYTIEDPPEYRIPKVSQIPVLRDTGNLDSNSRTYSPFLDPLKATMRGDPDVLMLGEVRDVFTADGLKKATQSGHQMLTTVHAASALGIVERLLDFEIPLAVLGSTEFLNGMIYQKLVPLLCDHCSLPFNVDSSDASSEDLKLAKRLQRILPQNVDGSAAVAPDQIRVKGKGCDKCKGTGIRGRTVCAEVITPDFEMFRLFREGKVLEAKEYWLGLTDNNPNSDNMVGKTVLEHALLKMRKGWISPKDIEEIIDPVDAALDVRDEVRRDRLKREAVSTPHRAPSVSTETAVREPRFMTKS